MAPSAADCINLILVRNASRLEKEAHQSLIAEQNDFSTPWHHGGECRPAADSCASKMDCEFNNTPRCFCSVFVRVCQELISPCVADFSIGWSFLHIQTLCAVQLWQIVLYSQSLCRRFAPMHQ